MDDSVVVVGDLNFEEIFALVFRVMESIVI